MMMRACLILSLVCLTSACPSGGGSDHGSGTGSFGSGSGTPPGDTGSTATSLVDNPLSGVCRTYSGQFYFSSNGGKLITSTDGSNLVVLDGTAVDMNAVHCDQTSVTDRVWFVGSGGSIISYDGSALNSETSGVTTELDDVYGTDPSNVYVVGSGGVILQYQGSMWTPQTSGVTTHLRGLDGRGSVLRTFLVAVGDNCTILETSNGGTTWTSGGETVCEDLGIPSDTDFYDVFVDDQTGNIFIVGSAGTVIHYDGTWAVQAPSATSVDLLAVQGMSATEAIAVGEEGVVLHYTGTGWLLNEDAPSATHGVRMSDVWMGGNTAMAVGAASIASDAEGFIMGWNGSVWSELL